MTCNLVPTTHVFDELRSSNEGILTSKNEKVNQHINALPTRRQAFGLRAQSPDLRHGTKHRDEFKWSHPRYELDGKFCSSVANRAHMSLAFRRDTELDDPERLLEGTGKFMRHIKIPFDGRIPPSVRPLLKNAAKHRVQRISPGEQRQKNCRNGSVTGRQSRARPAPNASGRL